MFKSFFSNSVEIPTLRLSGVIGQAGLMRSGLNISSLDKLIDQLFSYKKAPAVALIVNSPGGSPTQSSLISKKIIKASKEKNKKVLVFAEDVAASGGYLIACAGDEIYANSSSIVGSIGVISSWLNFSTLYERVGITTDSLKRGNNSLYFSMQHLLSDGERKKLEESTEEVYQTFKNKVLEGRNLDPSFDLDKDIARSMLIKNIVIGYNFSTFFLNL